MRARQHVQSHNAAKSRYPEVVRRDNLGCRLAHDPVSRTLVDVLEGLDVPHGYAQQLARLRISNYQETLEDLATFLLAPHALRAAQPMQDTDKVNLRQVSLFGRLNDLQYVVHANVVGASCS